MLRDVTSRLIRHEDDMEIVGQEVPREMLGDEVRRVSPNVVIITGDASNFPNMAHRIFRECPYVKFLVLEDLGRTAFLYELAPTRVTIGEISPAGLIEAIRQAAS
jgi:hypothetical protein